MRSLAACLALLVGLVAAVHAQPAFLRDSAGAEGSLDTRHLKAQVVIEPRIGEDGKGSVTLSVTPASRMHIYAHDVQGYVPFSVDFEPRADLVATGATYPASELYIFPPTGESSHAYMKPFRVTRTFAVKGRLRDQVRASAQGTPITLVLRYQACDDRVCYKAEQRSLVVTARAR